MIFNQWNLWKLPTQTSRTQPEHIQWINSIKCLMMTLRCPVTILSVPCPWRHPYLRREFLRRMDRSQNSNLDIWQCLKCCENAPWSLLWSSPLRVPHSRISSWCNLQQSRSFNEKLMLFSNLHYSQKCMDNITTSAVRSHHWKSTEITIWIFLQPKNIFET